MSDLSIFGDAKRLKTYLKQTAASRMELGAGARPGEGRDEPAPRSRVRLAGRDPEHQTMRPSAHVVREDPATSPRT